MADIKLTGDHQIAAGLQVLRQRLNAVAARIGSGDSKSKLGEFLGIPRNTVGEYFWNDALPSSKTLAKIRKNAPEITDSDAKIIELAYSRKSSLTRSGTGSAKANNQPVNNQPPLSAVSSKSDNDDARIGRIMRHLFGAILEKGRIQPLVTDPLDLLSQVMERYQIGDMRAVLTKENFQHIDISTWSETQARQFLAYANLVLEETRKCFVLLSQFAPDAIREELLSRLGRNADLLLRTFKVATSVVPMEYVHDISLEHLCVQPQPKERK